ncbi:ABC transporter ATP-binding protein [Agromyces aureus]|uniref:Dipeptide/oligopeptide/nickel ABC transporter ATP-binding protein n=1 Tax=Agromyces aureus TaxID=453304 RepID=A0A191WCX9_9MICO|nr:ABC transporter ATP-binding protein [Agromyces aureus]ANJ26058.1 dipeptide/oligopeptide/nickel ABC transporter ATP-binding protein [Agromyces aureus]
MSILEVTGLTVTRPDGLRLVDEVTFDVDRAEVVGIVGESGSGKTMTGMALLGLVPEPLTVGGSIRLNGRELATQSQRQWQRTRGREIAMVLQDPSSSLHPMLKLGEQLTDHLRSHLGMRPKAARARALELLEQVHLPDGEDILRRFPHQLSGGMKQRVAIAIALACEPAVLVADEVTTALDANIRVGILRLLDELRRTTGMGIMFITHDLAMLSSFADRVSVFRRGEIVEQASAAELFANPQHPYTHELLDAVPSIPWKMVDLEPVGSPAEGTLDDD